MNVQMSEVCKDVLTLTKCDCNLNPVFVSICINIKMKKIVLILKSYAGNVQYFLLFSVRLLPDRSYSKELHIVIVERVVLTIKF